MVCSSCCRCVVLRILLGKEFWDCVVVLVSSKLHNMPFCDFHGMDNKCYNSLMEQFLISHFFFFFYWLQPWVGLGLFNDSIPLLSILDLPLQPIIFILFRSSSTWSIHLNLGLPDDLVLYGVQSVIFLVALVFPILITWAAHLSLCEFINFIISYCFIICLSASFVLILHVSSGFCVGL